MAFRRLSSTSIITDLGENDDEAEKEERRSKASGSSNSSNSTSNISSTIVNLSAEEMNNQIDQCLKLNAANKINDKNAFQLKMIDFLVYALKKQNPKFTNLQMSSACLDASSKIYGFRVDKVHSDVLKIIGGSRGDKRPHDNEDENLCNQDANGNVINQPRKKRKRHHNLLLSVEALRGNIETYNPLSMLDNQVDTQTSDCLHQVRLPKHASQGISLNLYNDVVLDRIPVDMCNFPNFLIPKVVDYTCGQLCPSYTNFKFLGWTLEDESMDTSEPTDNNDPNESDGEYHFSMDDPVVEEEKSKNIMDYRDNQEERFSKIAQNQNQDQQQLEDFQDIIANNSNPDVTYEYSYVQENHSINLIRPSYWRLHIKRDIRYIGAVGSPRKVRRKKDIQLEYTEDTKEEADSRFVLANKPPKLLKPTYMNWSEDHIMIPNFMLPHFMQYDKNRFCSYFSTDKKVHVLNTNGKIENKEEDMRESQDEMSNFNLSNFGNGFQNNEDFHLNLDEPENQLPDLPFMFPDSEPPSQEIQDHGAFIGGNLVSLPKLTENVFIPYSQHAKKIDMRQLKKSVHHILKNADTKEFSELYRELPAKLSKVNSQSLSPGLAFMSILHVSHENKLLLKSHSNYTNVTIRNCDKVQQ